MDNFDVYLAYVVFDEYDFGKVRPTTIIEFEVDSEMVAIIPIYSYKPIWETSGKIHDMLKVEDWQIAGLTTDNSYLDVSRIVDYKKADLLKFKRLGHLSDRDIDRLIDKLSE